MIDIPDGFGDCTSLNHFLNKLQVYHHPVLVHLHTWVLVSSPPPSHSQTPPKHPSSSYFPKEKGEKPKKKPADKNPAKASSYYSSSSSSSSIPKTHPKIHPSTSI
jgi:hypothetical protein